VEAVGESCSLCSSANLLKVLHAEVTSNRTEVELIISILLSCMLQRFLRKLITFPLSTSDL
jgi:hypothetical protein